MVLTIETNYLWIVAQQPLGCRRAGNFCNIMSAMQCDRHPHEYDRSMTFASATGSRKNLPLLRWSKTDFLPPVVLFLRVRWSRKFVFAPKMRYGQVWIKIGGKMLPKKMFSFENAQKRLFPLCLVLEPHFPKWRAPNFGRKRVKLSINKNLFFLRIFFFFGFWKKSARARTRNTEKKDAALIEFEKNTH